MPDLRALRLQLSKPLKDKIRTALLIVLALLAALSVFFGVRNAIAFSQDFQYDAAKALAMGLDPYELSKEPEKALEYPELSRFYAMFTDQGLKQKMEANQFPSLLMLLIPMTFFPPQAEKIVWCALNLLFTALIFFLLDRTFFEGLPRYDRAVIYLLTLAGTPYRNQLGVGQHTLFSLCFFLLAVYIEKKQPYKASANTLLVAFCLFVSYFKYTLTAPLALYFVYKRRYKELLLSVAGHVLLTEAAALYLDKSFMYMITAPLAVASNLASEGSMDFGVIFPGIWALAAASVVCAVLLFMALKLPEGAGDILFAVLVLWSLVIVYHRIYDFFALSCVAVVFYTDLFADRGPIRQSLMKALYVLGVFMLYFGMKLTGESPASVAFTAILYYSFTILLTYQAFGLITVKKDGQQQDLNRR